MQDWWDALTTFERVFWYIAIPFSVILIIQIVLTFIGLDGGSSDVGGDLPDDVGTSDIDHSHAGADHSGFSVFTFRNFVAFFAVFGWAGIVGIQNNFSDVMVVIFGIACGLLIMLIISTLFYFISRMTDSGNLDIRNAINQIGNVYLPIRANSGNIGKIQITVQDSNREMNAVTHLDQDLPTGTVVRVTGIESGNILVVEKLKN
ncbi:MAG: NfeD family protein [Bacteroidales bacterium]|nr:NfeD family protein [Bacteroidales bacterium]